MKPVWRILCFPLLLLGSASVTAATPGPERAVASSPLDAITQQMPRSSPVRAELIADVEAVAAGRVFLLGVHFRIDPQWHIYWSNSGDSGLPTRIRWRLPEGFEAGPLQWPAPEWFEESAEITTYGYADSVLLFSEITPPDQLNTRNAWTFAADVSWLMCRENCIPGEASLELDLPAGSSQSSPQKPLFDRFREHVPRPIEHEAVPLSVTLPEATPLLRGTQPHTIRLEVKPHEPWTFPETHPQPPVRLFPDPPDTWKAGHPVIVSQAKDETRFDWTFRARDHAENGHTKLGLVVRATLNHPDRAEQRTVAARIGIPVERVEPGAPAPVRSATPGRTSSEPTPPGGAPSEPTASHLDGLALWKALFYAFLGGLILNIMPCVLPVISLKVLGFVQQAGQEGTRVFRFGLTFGLGVLVSFGLLAGAVILLKNLGTQVGWGFHLQQPRFIIILAAIVLAFGLSLLGVFEVNLPGLAAGGLDNATRREGYLGTFSNGVLATVLATPCTAPFLGPAMAIAFTQPAWLILTFFLTVGLGLTAPYIVLSSHPGWLRFLPRPGPWMETFKQLMGFLLLATTVWLLSVVGAQLGVPGLVWTLAFLLTVGIACWLFGKACSLRTTRLRRGIHVTLAFILIVTGYLWFAEQHLQARADPERPAGGIAWREYAQPRVRTLVEQGHAVFVDFTADWCVTCKVNERVVLSTEKVRRAFERTGVVPFKADWTQRDPEIARVLADLGRSGVPVYVIYPANRYETPVLLPTILTPGMVVEALEQNAPPDPPTEATGHHESP